MTTILEKTAGLVAFVRTVEAGSFSVASRLLAASPSAVSKSVARLERRLGVRLIQRSTRTLRLTPEGVSYYERVAPLLRAIDDAEDVVQSTGDVRGRLRITVPSDFGRALIACWIPGFSARHPGIKLELNVTDRQVDLIREGYDIAIRVGPLQDTGLTGRVITDLETALVASPDYLARRGTPKKRADLYDHACLRYLGGGRPVPFVFADGEKILCDGPLDCDDGCSLRQAALNGAGIALVLRPTVDDDIKAGRLIHILPRFETARVPVHVLHAFGRQLPPRARLFIDFVTKQVCATST